MKQIFQNPKFWIVLLFIAAIAAAALFDGAAYFNIRGKSSSNSTKTVTSFKPNLSFAVDNKEELLARIKESTDAERTEKIIDAKINDFLNEFEIYPKNIEGQRSIEKVIGGVYLQLGYLYAQLGKYAHAVQQFEKEEHIRNQYYHDLPSWVYDYDDNYLQVSKIVIPYFGSDLYSFRQNAPELAAIFRPQDGNLDLDEEMEVVIPLFSPQIESKDFYDKHLQGDYDFDYGGFIVFDVENGKYISHIHRIDYNKYSFPFFEDTNNDGRHEITFSIKAWDETQGTNGRYLVNNIYQYDKGVIKLIGSKKITENQTTHPDFIFNNVSYTALQELVHKDYPGYERDRIELIPFKNSDSLFMAHLVFEPSWWSAFVVGRYNGGKIQWLKREDTVKMANYILSLKEIRLKGFANPIIEVYDSTHMGNGSFYLFEVNKYTLALLVKTRAVDSHMDSATHPLVCGDRSFSASSSVFRDKKLAVEYADLNNDGIDDFILSGMMDIYCNSEYKGDGISREIDDIDYLYKSIPAKKVFLFDAKEREERGFKEDIAQKAGFDEWQKIIEEGSLLK